MSGRPYRAIAWKPDSIGEPVARRSFSSRSTRDLYARTMREAGWQVWTYKIRPLPGFAPASVAVPTSTGRRGG